MSSQRKLDSARANGALSQGPVTPEGRARSAMNALTHGFTSRKVVLACESEEDFARLRDGYLAEYQPGNRHDLDLIDQLVNARWRLERVWAIETALIDLEMAHQEPQIKKDYDVIDDEVRTAIAFRSLCDNSRALATLSRYEGRFRRACERLLAALERRRKTENRKNEPNPNNEHPGPVQ